MGNGDALSEDYPDAYAPRTTDPVNFDNVDAGFHLVQDGNGAVKGLSPAEHVMPSRSVPHRLSDDHFSPDPKLSIALAWELESTPAEIDAFRQVTGNLDSKKR